MPRSGLLQGKQCRDLLKKLLEANQRYFQSYLTTTLVRDGKVYVDGGVTNNLPVDTLPASDITLAVDVASEPVAEEPVIPGTLTLLSSSIRIMLGALMQAKLEQRDNVLLVQPETRTLGPLDLHRLEEGLTLATPQTDLVKTRLEKIFNDWEKSRQIVI